MQASVLQDFPRAVKHWTPVHIYHATSHSTGRIALLDDNRIAPGESATVDLICDESLAVRHGDQLVLRDQSLDVTLGGATVIYAQSGATQRRREHERLQRLSHYANPDASGALHGLLQDGLVDIKEFQNIWHLSQDQIDQLLEDQAAMVLESHACSAPYWQTQQASTLNIVAVHQKAQPSSPGLKENSFEAIPEALRPSVLSALVQTNKLINIAGLYKLPEHKVELPDALSRIWQRLEPELDQKQAPSSGDLAKLWRIPQQTLESDLKELSKRGFVTHIANHRFYLPRQLQALASEVKSLAAQKPFSVREFRDATSIGRNVAIEVLEYFDRRGFTRRQDNERVVMKDKL